MDIETMELEEVRKELDTRGVTYHANTGDKKLRELLAAALKEDDDDETSDKEEAPVKEKPKETKAERAKRKEREAMKLVRIVVSPNDPAMASHPGMIFTVGSSGINKGRMIKKMVPFNNEEGWHVPNIIYQQIKNATMQKFKTVKAPNGEKQLVPYLTKRYNVEVLEDLTQEELDALAAAQKARGDA